MKIANKGTEATHCRFEATECIITATTPIVYRWQVVCVIFDAGGRIVT